MIIFSTGGKGERIVLGFGLSRGNINQLIKGNPVLAPLDQLGVKFRNMDAYIFFGETEEEMTAELRELITEGTQVFDYKKGVEN